MKIQQSKGSVWDDLIDDPAEREVLKRDSFMLASMTERVGMDEGEIERAVSNIVGNMRMEGCEVTEADIAKYKAVLRGELDAETEIQKLIKKYKKTPDE